MLPHEKEMVARKKNQPFALLGISSDTDRESAIKRMKAEGITWRQAMEGSTSGPLATKWDVHGWPTIFVLDHKGVIRFQDLRGEELEKAVDELLKEVPAPAK